MVNSPWVGHKMEKWDNGVKSCTIFHTHTHQEGSPWKQR